MPDTSKHLYSDPIIEYERVIMKRWMKVNEYNDARDSQSWTVCVVVERRDARPAVPVPGKGSCQREMERS